MKKATLGEVATIERRGVDPAHVDPETPYVGLEHIERGGRITGTETVSSAEIKSTKFHFTPEHLLFGKLRPNLGKIARPVAAGVCSTDILPVLPGPELSRDYLFHFLSQQRTIDFAASQASGANLPRLSPKTLEDFIIPLPPLDQQRRIAAILDHADKVRDCRSQVVVHLDELSRATFLEMFGRYSERVVSVEEVAAQAKGSIRTGPFGSQLLHTEFVEEGVAVLGLDNVVGNAFSWGERRYITPEKYEVLKRYTVLPGDVLVSIMGTCGRCVVVPSDVGTAINTKHICAITLDPSKAFPEFVRAAFLWHPLSRQHLLQRTKGSIMDGLNMGIIKEMPLPLPPLEDQRRFVEQLRKLGALTASCAASSNEIGTLFAALQSRAFSGQL